MDLQFILQLLQVGILIVMSGMFSGLTIGLMGLGYGEVKRASELGSEDATKVLVLIKDSNLLLVTLLLGNTAVNSTLSMYLGELIGAGFVAGIAATFLILIFGEILPAALLSKHALKVGAFMAPVVIVLRKGLYPVTKPIAMVLDKYVGQLNEVFFSLRELIHIINNHKESKESTIDELDSKIITGAMLLADKTVGEHMTREVYSVSPEDILTEDLIMDIKVKGHTRIPVILDNNIVGLLHAKDLININKNSRVADFMSRSRLLEANTEAKLDNVLESMIENDKHIHMAVVKSFDSIVGVLTMEDIIEEILQVEIQDEFDK